MPRCVRLGWRFGLSGPLCLRFVFVVFVSFYLLSFVGQAAVLVFFACFGLCLSFLPPVLLAEVVAYGLLVVGSPLKFMLAICPQLSCGLGQRILVLIHLSPKFSPCLSPRFCSANGRRWWNFCSYVTCVFVVKNHLFSFLSLAFLLFSLPV